MNQIIPAEMGIHPMTTDAIARVVAFEQEMSKLPQVEIHTHHVIHAGMYSRTILIPAGIVLTGALIKRPTQLVVCGDVLMSRGDEDGVRITGTMVIPASAGRKQVFVTYADTTVTMVFPTDATTVEQAEAEFTDDTNMLISRRDVEHNTIIITGE